MKQKNLQAWFYEILVFKLHAKVLEENMIQIAASGMAQFWGKNVHILFILGILFKF